jgi:hypothetical protein
MRRVVFILAALVLAAISGSEAHAAQFGTRDSFQHLQDLTARGPKGEGLSLGYVTTTHSFILPYKMTGNYVLVVKGSGRDLGGRAVDVYDKLSLEKIGQMQRAGALPNPLPPYRHTIFDYLTAYVLWWCIPATIAFIALFSWFGLGSSTRSETRSA